jgi:hypothetical protein
MLFKFLVTNYSLRRDSRLTSCKIAPADPLVQSLRRHLATYATILAPASKLHRIEPRAEHSKRR